MFNSAVEGMKGFVVTVKRCAYCHITGELLKERKNHCNKNPSGVIGVLRPQHYFERKHSFVPAFRKATREFYENIDGF